MCIEKALFLPFIQLSTYLPTAFLCLPILNFTSVLIFSLTSTHSHSTYHVSNFFHSNLPVPSFYPLLPLLLFFFFPISFSLQLFQQILNFSFLSFLHYSFFIFHHPFCAPLSSPCPKTHTTATTIKTSMALLFHVTFPSSSHSFMRSEHNTASASSVISLLYMVITAASQYYHTLCLSSTVSIQSYRYAM